jgi:hypothetical protein
LILRNSLISKSDSFLTTHSRLGSKKFPRWSKNQIHAGRSTLEQLEKDNRQLQEVLVDRWWRARTGVINDSPSRDRNYYYGLLGQLLSLVIKGFGRLLPRIRQQCDVMSGEVSIRRHAIVPTR